MIFCIKDAAERKKFLSKEHDTYKICDLDLKNVCECNFCDGNSYIFENCLLNDVSLHFNNASICFQKCAFEGKIYIDNTYEGEECEILFRNNKPCEMLYTLTINAKNVIISNSEIECKGNISIVSRYCDIIKTILYTPYVSIIYENICSIFMSNITHLGNISKKSLNIDKSNINDQYIHIKEYIDEMDKPKVK